MIKRILYSILVLLAAAGCTERIEVELDETSARLVVDGCVATDNKTYQVNLTRSAGYFYNAPMPRVTGATVTLSDGPNTYALAETRPGESGVYATDKVFEGKASRTYTLRVELQEPISGHTTFEASSVLNPVTSIDSVSCEFHPDYGKEGTWFVNLWAQEPGDEVNYYMFDLYRNGILMTDSIHKKEISEDIFFNGNYLSGLTVMYLDQSIAGQKLFPGDTITLQVSGITKEYFNFIDQVKRSGFNLPFFSGPPANIQGNVSNGAIGFFSAYSSRKGWTVAR
jgi:hypothetical protein